MININDVCRYDEMVPLSILTESEINKKTYGDIKKDREYLDQLKVTLEDQGLNSPLTVYKGTTQIIKGHHRKIILNEAGNEKAPVVYVEKPKSKTEEMEMVLGDNLRKKLTITEKHKAVKHSIKVRVEEHGDIDDKHKKQYCAMVQLGWDSFKKLEELLNEGRKDLYDRIDADQDSLSLKRAYQMMNEDIKNSGKKLSASPALFDIVKTRHITKTLHGVSESMNEILSVQTRLNGIYHKFLPYIQENGLSLLTHELFSHSLAKVMSMDEDINCVAPNNQKINDLEITGYNWSPETKTSIFGGNTKMPKGWISHSQKQGYFFLLTHNDDYTLFGLIYCFVPFEAWKRAGTNWKLELSKVAELENKKIMCGKLKQDKNDEWHLHLGEPRIGE